MDDQRKVLDLLSLSGPGYTLPQPFYSDPELYEFDIAAVFSRSWLMIGFEIVRHAIFSAKNWEI